SVHSPKPMSALDKINATEREFEESAKRAPATAKAADSVSGAAHAAAAVAATAAAVAAKGFGATEAAKAKAVDDFEFTIEDREKPAPMGKASAEARHEGDSVSPALARPQAAIDLDKLDLSFDPQHTTFEDPTPSVVDGQWHDAATKLDLAKAYQEMGDVE